jgi:Xaa-Pro aminopeptidase
VTHAEVHAKAIAALAPLNLHPALSGSVGHGIGLSLHEGPEFGAAEAATLEGGGVYTLQIGATDNKAGNALLSAIVRCTAKGADVLARSSSAVGG